jgi:acyl carrier protein
MLEPRIREWNEKTILVRLKQIAREQLNMTPEQVATIHPDSKLIDTLRLDSLGQVVLVTTVEQDFGCAFEPEEWQELDTVDDLLKMIAKSAGKEQTR